MNGSISLKSEPGKGSIFEITFRNIPVSETSPIADGSVMTDYENIIFENAVILIADDIRSNRELIKAFFGDMPPIRIVFAENGQEAVSLAGQYEPDMILMDIRMPVMDGYEAARQLKDNEKLRRIPVIATTASALSENIEKIMKDGLFDGFIAKPVRKSDLFRELCRFIPHTGGAKSEEQKEIKEKECLPPELIEKLENEFTVLWKEVCKSRILGDIETFADKIRSAGQEYSSELLIGYGQELINHTRNFDIEKVKSVLYSYPKLIEKSGQDKD